MIYVTKLKVMYSIGICGWYLCMNQKVAPTKAFFSVYYQKGKHCVITNYLKYSISA